MGRAAPTLRDGRATCRMNLGHCTPGGILLNSGRSLSRTITRYAELMAHHLLRLHATVRTDFNLAQEEMMRTPWTTTAPDVLQRVVEK